MYLCSNYRHFLVIHSSLYVSGIVDLSISHYYASGELQSWLEKGERSKNWKTTGEWSERSACLKCRLALRLCLSARTAAAVLLACFWRHALLSLCGFSNRLHNASSPFTGFPTGTLFGVAKLTVFVFALREHNFAIKTREELRVPLLSLPRRTRNLSSSHLAECFYLHWKIVPSTANGTNID